MATAWELLEANRSEEALNLFVAEYARTRSPGTLVNIGIARLCLGDVNSAEAVFTQLQDLIPESATSYAWAGVVRWVQNEHRDAVRQWNAGVGREYADAAGGMELPLLLGFAAVRDPATCAWKTVKQMIEKQLSSGVAVNWPGPLGGYLLGMIDENQLRAKARKTGEIVAVRREAQTEFYKGVIALRARDEVTFTDCMRRVISARHSLFLRERYLALHELGLLTAGGRRK